MTEGIEELREKEIIERLDITRKDISIEVGSTAYPSIMFRFLVDSKADVDLEAEKLIAYVHIASEESPALGKVTWSKIEESLKVNSVPSIRAKDSGWVTIRFTPPFSAFKSEFADQWTLNGILVFKTSSENIGKVMKPFNVSFRVKKEEIKGVLEKYSNLA